MNTVIQQFDALLFTDLDGTLIADGAPVSAENVKIIEVLASLKIGVVPVSGRNLKMVEKVLLPDLPIPFAICSTGVGILNWPEKKLIRRAELNAGEAAKAATILRRFHANFMVHGLLPKNDRCHYAIASNGIAPCDDFYRRLNHMPEPRKELPQDWSGAPGASQLLAIFAPAEHEKSIILAKELSQFFSVVRTTSPLDHQSIWLEIFAPGVNKSSAASWLQKKFAPGAPCYALGNDFNDLDLLEWADHPLVMADSPSLLRLAYDAVNAAPEQVLALAATQWKLLPQA